MSEKQDKIQDKDQFTKELTKKFEKWTGIQDSDLEEAIRDFSGDLYLEVRRAQARICEEIERSNLTGDLKQTIKNEINSMWYNINSHQRIGADKLCMIISRFINEKK